MKKISPFAILAGCVIAAGIILRFAHIGASSLWIDEAWMATKALKPLSQVFSEYAETSRIASKFFITILHAFMAVFGATDVTARMIPALFGALSVPLFYMLTCKITGNRWIALAGTALLSFNVLILRYSQEVKPYSGEMFSTLGLCYLVECVISSAYKKSWLAWLAIASCIAVFVFPPMIFVVAAVTFRIILDQRERNILKSRAVIYPAFYLVGCSLLAGIHFLFLIQKPTSGVVAYALRKGFFPTGDNVMAVLTFVATKTYSVVQTLFMYKHSFPGHVAVEIALILLACGGLVYLCRIGKSAAVQYFGITAGLTLCATIFQHYLYGVPRFDLFFAQFIFIFVAAGAYWLLSFNKKLFPLATCITIIIMPAALYAQTGFKYYHPTEDIRSVVDWYANQVSADDYTFVPFPADAGFIFYMKNPPVRSAAYPDSTTFIAKSLYEKGAITAMLSDKKAYPVQHHTVWFLFQHFPKKSLVKSLRTELNKVCPIIDSIEVTGAAGYRLEC